MLHAIGFPDDQMPQLLAHGWWNLGGAKMSKSAGNIIDPFVLTDKYGTDALRYYLMSDIATGKDADFSEERLIERYNADLANSLGNLLNRTLSMVRRYSNGTLQIPPYSRTEMATDPMDWGKAVAVYANQFDLYSVSLAVDVPFGCVVLSNQFIEQKQPWAMVQALTSKADLVATLYTLAESLRIIAILISPVLPKAAHGIFDQLNWKMELSGKEERFSLKDAEWGGLPDGHVVGKPVPLFPRIEIT